MKICLQPRRGGPLGALLGVVLGVQAGDVPPAHHDQGGADARESWVADVLAWRQKAEKGDVESQVALADLFSDRQQFVEAVHWYRLAATNGEVTAQLALAGCLIAGRGAVEDRKEAAFWIRRAADGVERGVRPNSPADQPDATSSSSTPSPSSTATRTTNAVMQTPASASSAKNLFTNDDSRSTPASRRDNLSAIESRTQEGNLVLQPFGFDLPK